VLGVVGMVQAMLQIMLQGAGPVGCCPKVLKGVVSAGCYAYRAFCLQGVLLLGVLKGHCGCLLSGSLTFLFLVFLFLV
jgi:hypothetical protein